MNILEDEDGDESPSSNRTPAGKNKADKLHALERMTATLKQQVAGLRADVRAGDQISISIQMRSGLVDQAAHSGRMQLLQIDRASVRGPSACRGRAPAKTLKRAEHNARKTPSTSPTRRRWKTSATARRSTPIVRAGGAHRLPRAICGGPELMRPHRW